MNPSYTLFVDVCLTKPVCKDSIWMRLVTRVPFVPRIGDKIRLTEGDETLDVELANVTYDMSEGTFVEEQEDDQMVTNYSESGTLGEAEAVAGYSTFGFVRLNFPQGVGR